MKKNFLKFLNEFRLSRIISIIITSITFLKIFAFRVSAAAFDPRAYTEQFIIDKALVIQKAIVAVALALLVLTMPYLIYLWGTGTPENLKQAVGILESLVGGVLIVLLSGVIIKAFGQSFLGLN